MNVPAVARKTFLELRNQYEFASIYKSTLTQLKKIPDFLRRSKLVHKQVDEYNKEALNHPLVAKLSPCQKGCSACCHTQVSVTQDEAKLLALEVNEDTTIDMARLRQQMKAGNDSDNFYKLDYQIRQCVFLDEAGACRVYDNRPSVCRTNVVLGDASQCDTSFEIRPTRLIRTPKSDMVIYAAFSHSKTNGTLPFMLAKELGIRN